MKKYLFLLVIAACLCISGCKGKENKADVAPPAVQEETGLNSETNEEAESVMPEKSSGSIYFEADNLDPNIILVDSPEFTLNFRVYRDLSAGYYDYEYAVIKKKTDKDIHGIDLSNLRINGSELIGSEIIEGFGDGGEFIKAKRINGYIRVNDIDMVTSISGTARAVYMSGEVADNQYDFDIQVDSNESSAYNLQPYMDAVALTQNVLNDESVAIDLVGLGSFGDSPTSLKGLLHIMNKTDEEQFFSLNACVINKLCFDFPHAADICIKANTDYYYDFYITQNSITDTGINSISSVSLLMLTSESENTGISGEKLKGGQLYDVELYQKGNGGTPQIDGELLYDANDIKVYFVGAEAKEYNGYSTDFYTYVCVQNNTDKNISFGFSDSKLNGVSCREGGNELRRDDMSYTNRSTSDNIIPPGCCIKRPIILYEWAEIKLPCKAAFKLDFYTAGGGELICRSDEIVLNYTE